VFVSRTRGPAAAAVPCLKQHKSYQYWGCYRKNALPAGRCVRLQYSVLFVDDNGNQGISTFSPCFSRDRERKMRWTVDVHVQSSVEKEEPSTLLCVYACRRAPMFRQYVIVISRKSIIITNFYSVILPPVFASASWSLERFKHTGVVCTCGSTVLQAKRSFRSQTDPKSKRSIMCCEWQQKTEHIEGVLHTWTA
jgi:hypothetical protein